MSGFASFFFLALVFGILEAISLTMFKVPGLQTHTSRMAAALAAMFVFTGTAHFYATDAFVQSVPAFLPLRTEAVYISGVAEIAGAIGLLIPRFRRLAGLGLAAMLIVIFPANINVAVNNLQIELFPSEAAAQWIRLLLQPILIALVLWGSAEPRRRSHGVRIIKTAKADAALKANGVAAKRSA